MLRQVFTVYDEKSVAYLQPFFMDTVGQALRAITDCVNDPSHEFGIHTADYTLFSLGLYDTETALFEQEKASLGCLIEFKQVASVKMPDIGGIS